MRYLITGGSGFIGNSLARRILGKGESVGLILRKNSKRKRLENIEGDVSFFQGDVRNKQELSDAIKKYKPDLIYHFAAYGNFPGFQKNEEEILSTNAGGIINLIDSARGIPIINFGSSSEYGIKDKPMSEEDNCVPNNFYGKTKLMQTLYSKAFEIPTIRFFSVYGPGQEESQLIPSIVTSKVYGDKLNLINSVRDFIFIEDVLEAIEKATEKYQDIRGEIFNLGSGKQSSVKEILGIVDNFGDKKLEVGWNFQAIQEEPEKWVANISKTKTQLGWEPSTSLEKGLKEMYESILSETKKIGGKV